MLRCRRTIAGALLGMLLAGSVVAAVAEGVVTVSQIGKAFSVATLHIHRGDTVRFTNDDRFDHQIYIESPSFNFESAEQPPGTSKDVHFTTAGTFDVQCQIHPRMHLDVVVE